MANQGTPRPLCNAIDTISRPAVLAVLIAIYLVFPLYIFPTTAGDMAQLPLDLRFAYSPTEAYELLAILGPQGRESYMFGTTVVDVAYAICYTLMFAVWLTLLFRGHSRFTCAWAVAPMVVFVIDMVENTGIALMLSNYPSEFHGLALATSITTTCKWLLAGPLILTTLGMSIFRSGQWLFSQGKKNPPLH